LFFGECDGEADIRELFDDEIQGLLGLTRL
jgi:hypothetical protein